MIHPYNNLKLQLKWSLHFSDLVTQRQLQRLQNPPKKRNQIHCNETQKKNSLLIQLQNNGSPDQVYTTNQLHQQDHRKAVLIFQIRNLIKS